MSQMMFGILKIVGGVFDDNTSTIIAIAHTHEEAETFKTAKEEELIRSLKAQELIGDFCAEWEEQNSSPVIDYGSIDLVNIYAPENIKLNMSSNAELLEKVKMENLAKIQKVQQPLVEFHEAKKLALDNFKIKINAPVDFEWASPGTTFEIQEIPVI